MHKIFAIVTLSLATVTTFAADLNQPFDFSYVVNGRNNRPVNVFNDGESTYIQSKDKVTLIISNQNVTMRGPYYVISGIPDSIEGVAGSEPFKIEWQGAQKTSLTTEYGRKNADFNEKTFTGTFGRLSFINGVPPDVGLVNPLPREMQLRELIKAMAPHGWSGSADRSINTTQQIDVLGHIGDSWITVLDKVITASNIWAEIDSSKMQIYLRESPPKGFAVVLDANSQLRKPHQVSNGTPVEVVDSDHSTQVTIPESLLSTVNVRVIEHKNKYIEISVINSGKKIKVTDLESGQNVELKPTSPVDFTFPIIGSFKIESVDGHAIDVKRIFKKVAVFKQLNEVGLKSVEQRNGTTVFTFARQLPSIDFKSADLNSMPGTWQNDKFTINAQSPEWKIMTHQSAVQVDFEDKGVFLWRKSEINKAVTINN